MPISNALKQFVCQIGEKYGSRGFVDSELLSSEFREYFNLSNRINFPELQQLCRHLSIRVEEKPLEFPLRGLLGSFGDEHLISHSDGNWSGIKTFTIAHELKELILNIAAAKQYLHSVPLNSEALCESFASSLLLERYSFIDDCCKNQFNPKVLQAKCGYSYHVILIRMANVFRDVFPFAFAYFQNTKLFIHQFDSVSSTNYKNRLKRIEDPEDPEAFVATLVLQSPLLKYFPLNQVFTGFTVRKGSPLLDSSLAVEILRYGEDILDRWQRSVVSYHVPDLSPVDPITDGFYTSHFGIPAGVILISIPSYSRWIFDGRRVQPDRDAIMKDMELLGPYFGKALENVGSTVR